MMTIVVSGLEHLVSGLIPSRLLKQPNSDSPLCWMFDLLKLLDIGVLHSGVGRVSAKPKPDLNYMLVNPKPNTT